MSTPMANQNYVRRNVYVLHEGAEEEGKHLLSFSIFQCQLLNIQHLDIICKKLKTCG